MAFVIVRGALITKSLLRKGHAYSWANEAFTNSRRRFIFSHNPYIQKNTRKSTWTESVNWNGNTRSNSNSSITSSNSNSSGSSNSSVTSGSSNSSVTSGSSNSSVSSGSSNSNISSIKLRREDESREKESPPSNKRIVFTNTKPSEWLPWTLVAMVVAGMYRYWLYSINSSVNNPEKVAKNWQVSWYRFLPLKSLSRAWGWVHEKDLPEWAKAPVLRLYADTFHCNMKEAEEEDVMAYKNLGELFRRPLKEGARPIDSDSPIVSPSDGKILHFGEVKCGVIEQVKGVTYSIQQFLGPPTWLTNSSDSDPNNNSSSNKNISDNNSESKKCMDPLDPSLESNCEKYSEYIRHNPSETSRLYHVVIYLAPGDYHRFHSPTEWNMNFRRHFTGDLLSVSPIIAGFIPELFNLNERAVYVGDWQHGFFAMVAVGATNVGSIKIYSDEDLRTNKWEVKKGMHFDKKFPQSVQFNRGDPFGEFNLGSTIVLIFEGPPNFVFPFSAGELIRVGEKAVQIRKPKKSKKRKNKENAIIAT